MGQDSPPVSSIEVLDIEDPDQLNAYLRESGRITGGTPRVENLAGGVSCRTVLVELPSGDSWVLKQALPKLRVDVDWFSDPSRIHREALGMQWLGRLAGAGSVPALIFEDESQHLVAMQAVPRPHELWKARLLSGKIDERHVEEFGRLLGTIHHNAADHEDLAIVFDDRSFFESLRVEPYYAFSAEQVPEAASFLGDLIDETRAITETLVHGDYSPKNILIHEGRLVLLDHEVIHWGDGAFDLGFAMTHFLSKAHHLPDHREVFGRATGLFWETYRSLVADLPWERGLEPRAVRHTLGCLLARSVGRSQLEYLSSGERKRQSRAVVDVMSDPPATVADLVKSFLSALDAVSA